MPSRHAKGIVSFAAAAFAVLAAGPSLAADCAVPGQAPAVPDGATATVDQMKTAHDAVQSYVHSLEAYQDCLEARIKMTMKSTKPEELQKMRDAGNAAIDQAKQLSDSYAVQVKAYKARTAK
jgi:hypothetical protein